MESGDLRVFEAVARLGGMSRAAAELHTVQSNVTARIRQLEARLGVALFRRHSRGATLTAAGERLLPYARRMAQLLADARRAATEDGTPRGPLRIGSLETTAGLRLPPLLAAYTANHPAVALALTTGTTEELIDQVLAHGLEGAFVCGPVQHPDLAETAVFQEELVLVAPPRAEGLPPADGTRHVQLLVLRRGCSYRQRLEDWLTRRGVVAMRTLEFGSLDAIMGCVGAGIGITLLPRALVAKATWSGRVSLHPLEDGAGRVDTVFIHRHDAFCSSARAAFQAMLRDGQAWAAAG